MADFRDFRGKILAMKTKSRFLRAPVEPFVVLPDQAASDLLARMERISFQGRNLAVARRIWEKMLADDCTIFFGMAGALSAGGLRMIVAYLIAHRYIDCLVSTGANLYHDLHETRGRHHYLGSPHEDDAALQAEHIDRVYDTYASEDEFCDNDEWIAAFALTLERAQPMESSRGLRNTASEKSVPMAMVMMTKAAPSTTQP